MKRKRGMKTEKREFKQRGKFEERKKDWKTFDDWNESREKGKKEMERESSDKRVKMRDQGMERE